MVGARSTLSVIPYERRYRAQMLDLIEYSYQRHTHLDWYEIEDWIEAAGGTIRLAFRGTFMIGMMAASRPVIGTSWLRFVALADGAKEDEVIDGLWQSMKSGLRETGTQSVWVLMLEPWFEYYMSLMGMTQAERLVTLRRENIHLPEAKAAGVTLLPATMDDVAAMTLIDQAAFTPPFPMTASEMRQAYRFAAQSRVAWKDERIVGYQISTRHGDQGHLARLAVEPQMQGHGIGAMLIRDMIAGFLRRGVEVVTVNTQVSNQHSLRAYAAAGFQRSGYEIPIYCASLL